MFPRRALVRGPRRGPRRPGDPREAKPGWLPVAAPPSGLPGRLCPPCLWDISGERRISRIPRFGARRFLFLFFRARAFRSTRISISFFSPRAGPSYYYCNCKEGNGSPTELPDFRGVTGLVEGSLASNLYSAGQHSRISAKGEKSSVAPLGGLGEGARRRQFLKGEAFACRRSADRRNSRLPLHRPTCAQRGRAWAVGVSQRPDTCARDVPIHVRRGALRGSEKQLSPRLDAGSGARRALGGSLRRGNVPSFHRAH